MRLKTFNNILVGLIILVNGYVIAAPFLPHVVYWWEGRGGSRQAQLSQAIRQQPPQTSDSETTAPAAQPNAVVIPRLLLDQSIVEGPVASTYKNLDKGIWRWPDGSSPDKGGNTILLGHRFTYTKPQGVLYFLNKVSVGDEVGLTWNNKKYVYRVSEVKVVPPSDTSILNQTGDDRLTIYTCTPLWNPTDRLVVIATKESL